MIMIRGRWDGLVISNKMTHVIGCPLVLVLDFNSEASTTFAHVSLQSDFIPEDVSHIVESFVIVMYRKSSSIILRSTRNAKSSSYERIVELTTSH